MADASKVLAPYFGKLCMLADNTVFVFDATHDDYSEDAGHLKGAYLEDLLLKKVSSTEDALVPFAVWECDDFENIEASPQEMLMKVQEESQIGYLYFYEQGSGRVFQSEMGSLEPYRAAPTLDKLKLKAKESGSAMPDLA